QKKALCEMTEIFVQSTHFIAARHQLALGVDQNEDGDVAALGGDIQDLRRQGQDARGAKRNAVRDANDGNRASGLASGGSCDPTGAADFHLMTRWKQALQNIIERHGWT